MFNECNECEKYQSIISSLEDENKAIKENLFKIKSESSDVSGLIKSYMQIKEELEKLTKENLFLNSNSQISNNDDINRLNYELNIKKIKLEEANNAIANLELFNNQLIAENNNYQKMLDKTNESNEFNKIKRELTEKEKILNKQNFIISQLKNELKIKNNESNDNDSNSNIFINPINIKNNNNNNNNKIINNNNYNSSRSLSNNIKVDFNNECSGDLFRAIKEIEYLQIKNRTYKNKYKKFKAKFETIESTFKMITKDNCYSFNTRHYTFEDSKNNYYKSNYDAHRSRPIDLNIALNEDINVKDNNDLLNKKRSSSIKFDNDTNKDNKQIENKESISNDNVRNDSVPIDKDDDNIKSDKNSIGNKSINSSIIDIDESKNESLQLNQCISNPTNNITNSEILSFYKNNYDIIKKKLKSSCLKEPFLNSNEETYTSKLRSAKRRLEEEDKKQRLEAYKNRFKNIHKVENTNNEIEDTDNVKNNNHIINNNAKINKGDYSPKLSNYDYSNNKYSVISSKTKLNKSHYIPPSQKMFNKSVSGFDIKSNYNINFKDLLNNIDNYINHNNSDLDINKKQMSSSNFNNKNINSVLNLNLHELEDKTKLVDLDKFNCNLYMAESNRFNSTNSCININDSSIYNNLDLYFNKYDTKFEKVQKTLEDILIYTNEINLKQYILFIDMFVSKENASTVVDYFSSNYNRLLNYNSQERKLLNNIVNNAVDTISFINYKGETMNISAEFDDILLLTHYTVFLYSLLLLVCFIKCNNINFPNFVYSLLKSKLANNSLIELIKIIISLSNKNKQLSDLILVIGSRKTNNYSDNLIDDIKNNKSNNLKIKEFDYKFYSLKKYNKVESKTVLNLIVNLITNWNNYFSIKQNEINEINDTNNNNSDQHNTNKNLSYKFKQNLSKIVQDFINSRIKLIPNNLKELKSKNLKDIKFSLDISNTPLVLEIYQSLVLSYKLLDLEFIDTIIMKNIMNCFLELPDKCLKRSLIVYYISELNLLTSEIGPSNVIDKNLLKFQEKIGNWLYSIFNPDIKLSNRFSYLDRFIALMPCIDMYSIEYLRKDILLLIIKEVDLSLFDEDIIKKLNKKYELKLAM